MVWNVKNALCIIAVFHLILYHYVSYKIELCGNLWSARKITNLLNIFQVGAYLIFLPSFWNAPNNCNIRSFFYIFSWLLLFYLFYLLFFLLSFIHITRLFPSEISDNDKFHYFRVKSHWSIWYAVIFCLFCKFPYIHQLSDWCQNSHKWQIR